MKTVSWGLLTPSLFVWKIQKQEKQELTAGGCFRITVTSAKKACGGGGEGSMILSATTRVQTLYTVTQSYTHTMAFPLSMTAV